MALFVAERVPCLTPSVALCLVCVCAGYSAFVYAWTAESSCANNSPVASQKWQWRVRSVPILHSLVTAGIIHAARRFSVRLFEALPFTITTYTNSTVFKLVDHGIVNWNGGTPLSGRHHTDTQVVSYPKDYRFKFARAIITRTACSVAFSILCFCQKRDVNWEVKSAILQQVPFFLLNGVSESKAVRSTLVRRLFNGVK